MRKTEYYGPESKLTETEVEALWVTYVDERDNDTRDRLIEYYIPLVYQTAERMAKNLPSFVDVNDLIQAGMIGLIDAIKKFEPDRDIKFSTYCCMRISGSILDELRRLDWAPRLVRSRVNQLERSKEELESALGRKPTDEEIADHMELTRDQYEALIKEVQVKSMISLDRKWDEDDDHELGQMDMIADKTAIDPHEELERSELRDVAIRGLSEKEKLVLVMYYYENMSLKEIGAVLNLSESRVCQIHAQTLEFLRKKFTHHENSTTASI
ncbi:MAG: FliA/WhiG family RNA polymerase sigma factor [Planctomycetes bacterium]|nr:FliA/WhiG family RNA polymerase sigma factor [Planctomycetota bacterium]